MQEKTNLSSPFSARGVRYNSRMGSHPALLLFVFFSPTPLPPRYHRDANLPPRRPKRRPMGWTVRCRQSSQSAQTGKLEFFYLELPSRSRGECDRPARQRQSGVQRRHKSDASRSVHPATIERMVSQPSASTRMTCGTTNSTKSQRRPKCQRRA